MITWRIIPVSKWLITMVLYGSGCGTHSKWPFIAYKWVILTTETNWEPILQVFSCCEPGFGHRQKILRPKSLPYTPQNLIASLPLKIDVWGKGNLFFSPPQPFLLTPHLFFQPPQPAFLGQLAYFM